MKKLLPFVSPLIIIGAIIFLSKDKKELEIKTDFVGNNISSATEITCSYSQTTRSVYQNNEIVHSLPKAETKPMIFSFSDIKNSEMSKLSYIDATQTITTVQISKAIDNEEKLVFFDGGEEGYFSTHTIYKDSGVSVFTKNVSIFGVPIATLAMGTCVGY